MHFFSRPDPKLNLHKHFCAIGEMKLAKFLVVLMFLIALPNLSFADEAANQVASRDAAATKFVEEYLLRLKSEKTAIFYGECYLKHGGKAAIVIPLGGKAGLYIERNSDKTVANTADMNWVDGQWRTEVAQGGVYTITRANNLIGELLISQFQIMLPNKLDFISTSKPKKACTEKLPQ